NRSDEPAHQRIVKLHPLGIGIGGATLHHVPGSQHGHDVVIEVYLCRDDLSAAWVGDDVTGSVGPLRGFVDDHGVAAVLNIKIRVLSFVRDLPRHDGVLKPCGLKGLLPIVYALNKVRYPLPRGGGVNIKDNGFGWLDEFTAIVPGEIFRAGFEAPSLDIADNFHTLRIGTIVGVAFSEVAHTPVGKSFLHWYFRQHHNRRVDLPREGVTGDIIALTFIGFYRADLNIERVGLNVFDVAHVCEHAPDLHLLFDAG